jgi:hypothetical protein
MSPGGAQTWPCCRGAFHRAYQRTSDFGYGPVRVTGLCADDRLRNFAVLDVESMTWRLRGRGLLDLGRPG